MSEGAMNWTAVIAVVSFYSALAAILWLVSR